MPILILIALMCVGIALILGYTHVRGTVDGCADTFCDGVYINGVALSGKTMEEARTELDELASLRLDATWHLTYEDLSWDFSPRAVGASLSADEWINLAWNFGHTGDLMTRYNTIRSLPETPVYYESERTYDTALIDAFVEEIRAAIDSEPESAEIVVDVKGPVVTKQSVNGRKLDTEALAESLNSMVLNGEGDTQLPVEILYPEVTSDDAQNGLQKLVMYQTDVTFRGPNSRGNVALALSKFDGLAVHPGDVVNFNTLVGKRTKENGFKEAPEYAGNRTTNGIGGGVCQAATTMYGAMLLSGMTITERHNHTMTVSYVQPSLDAAVSDDGKNLVFRNDQDFTIYIYTKVDEEWATIYVYGKNPPYKFFLESKILSTRDTYNTTYVDYNATYVTYTDQRQLVTKGKKGCSSEGYLVAYDWTTREEVGRKLLSTDSYSPSPNIYYVGAAERVGIIKDY